MSKEHHAKKTTTHRLDRVAAIHMGYPIRGRVEHDPDGELGLVQMKCVDPVLGVNESKIIRTRPTTRRPPLFLEVGDILFVNRGQRLFSVLIDKPLQNAIAAPHFFVIRPKPDIVTPEFLTWFMNHKRARRFLSQRAAGSGIPHVTRASLASLKVNAPDMATQNKVVAMHKCWLKEKELAEDLLVKREQLITNVLDLAISTEE